MPKLVNAALLVASMAAAGCERSDVSVGLVETRRIVLEQSDTSLISVPSLSIANDGRLVATDMQEKRVRIYAPEGSLLTQFGREGEGPGEFTAPIRAVLQGDVVWVLDVQRGLSSWDLENGRMLTSIPSPYPLSVSMDALTDTLLVVGGIVPPASPWTVVSVVDAKSGEVVSSFLDRTVDESQRGLAMTMTSVPFAIGSGPVLAGMHSWSDTLRIFDLPSGRQLHQLAVPIPGFTYEGTIPSSETLGALRVVREVFMVPDDRFLVQYAVPTMNQLAEEYGLLLLSRDGDVVDHRRPVPKLLDVQWPELFFADSTGLAPQEITVMEYRE